MWSCDVYAMCLFDRFKNLHTFAHSTSSTTAEAAAKIQHISGEKRYNRHEYTHRHSQRVCVNGKSHNQKHKMNKQA